MSGMMAGAWNAAALTAPLLALACFQLAKHSGRTHVHRLLAGCTALLLLLVILDLAGVVPASGVGDDIEGGIALFAVCVAAGASSLIRWAWLRWLAALGSGLVVVAAWLVMVMTLIAGPDPVLRTQTMPGGLVCEVHAWGMAFTDSGYRVELYQLWPGLPFKRRVASLTVTETQPDSLPQHATCADGYAAAGRH